MATHIDDSVAIAQPSRRVLKLPEREAVPQAYAVNSCCVGLGLQCFAVATLGLAFCQNDPLCFLLIAAIFQTLAVATFLKPGGIGLLTPFTITVTTIALAWGVRPLYLFLSREPLTYAGDLHWEATPLALTLVLGFTVLFGIGYFTRTGAGLARRLPVPSIRLWSARQQFRAVIILGIATFCLFGVLTALVGTSLFAAYADSLSFRMASGAEGMTYFSRTGVICLWSMLYVVLVRSVHDRFHVLRLIVPTIMLLVSCVLILPFGSRGYLIMPVVGALWLFDSCGITRLNILRIGPPLIVLTAVLAVLGVYRNSSREGDTSLARLVQELEQEGLEGLLTNTIVRFDSFDFLLWTVANYPTIDEDFLYGRSVVDFLVQPVPRAFYPNKRYKTSAFLIDLQMPDVERRFTPEYSLIAELYINFWIPGVLVGALLWGVFVRCLDTYIDLHRRNPTVQLWYMPLVFSVMFWLFAGLNSDTSVYVLMSTAQTWLVRRFLL
jgi:hypothetical protein